MHDLASFMAHTDTGRAAHLIAERYRPASEVDHLFSGDGDTCHRCGMRRADGVHFSFENQPGRIDAGIGEPPIQWDVVGAWLLVFVSLFLFWSHVGSIAAHLLRLIEKAL